MEALNDLAVQQQVNFKMVLYGILREKISRYQIFGPVIRNVCDGHDDPKF